MTKFNLPQVMTFDQATLREASVKLWKIAFDAFAPNVIVGVRTGGYHVAAMMSEVAPPGLPLLAITCRRPRTSVRRKFGVVKRLLAILPYMVTDMLRVVEHLALASCMKSKKHAPMQLDDREVENIVQAVQSCGSSARILIVDDSIDSGVTLVTVTDALRKKLAPTVTLKTAVITVTMETPLLQPDFVLYHNILCRCPWSDDYKS